MIASIPWIAVILGFTTLAVLVLGVWTVLRIRARAVPASAEELVERAALPLTPLQKIAGWGFVIGLAQVGAILAIFLTQGGPSAYWEDDDMRMLVVALFLSVIPTFGIVRAMLHSRTDERDRPLLSWAGAVQSTLVLITLAAWTAILPKLFHAEGAVPVVYCYLIFGSVFIVHMVSYPLGILLASWRMRHHAEG